MNNQKGSVKGKEVSQT